MFKGWFRSISALLFVLALANVPVWAQTLEGWAVLPADTFAPGPLNDNNYPGSSGRNPGQPDNNEFILIKLDQPLAVAGKK